jgi:hypothetical protein
MGLYPRSRVLSEQSANPYVSVRAGYYFLRFCSDLGQRTHLCLPALSNFVLRDRRLCALLLRLLVVLLRFQVL